MRKISMIGILALAIWVSMVAAQATPNEETSSVGQKLEGTWLVTVTRQDSGTFLSLQTYLPSGQFLAESNNNVVRSLAYGDWLRIGDRQFIRTFMIFRFDGPMRRFIGTQKVTAIMQLSEDLKEYSGVANIELYDADGNLEGSTSATEEGRRLETSDFPDPPELP